MRLRLPRFRTRAAGEDQTVPPGGSIRMTSAPKSASIIATAGPATYWPKSMTRIPSSAAAMALDLLHFPWEEALRDWSGLIKQKYQA